ncbi:uncharacterized protein LOC120711371 [Panicum virgatum]|nr:uncharacterized protein LOC120711371 [Panicum virgatum]
MARATPAGATGGEVAVQICAEAAAADAAAGGGSESQRRERRLNCFVWVVALGEWAGNAFGALAFVWATAVLLGGFCSNLKPQDFRFATVIIFIEAFRIFSRNYKLDNQSLFGTTRALRWINVSFAHMLGRPQEGNEVVLTMGLWIDLINWLPVDGLIFLVILQEALMIVMSKMQIHGYPQLTNRSRRRRRLLLGAVLVAFLIIYGLDSSKYRGYLESPSEDLKSPSEDLKSPSEDDDDDHHFYSMPAKFSSSSTEILTQVVAALLLIFRPPVVANLTNTTYGRRLLSLAKVISVVSLGFGFVVALFVRQPELPTNFLSSIITAFTVAVLSLGSLQTPAANNTLLGARWIDVMMNILFLWYLLLPNPIWIFHDFYGGSRRITIIAAGLSLFVLWVAVLLMENLQIPAAALQVLLSSSRFHGLQTDYGQPPQDSSTSPNLVPAIRVFYVLALCEGSLYITASILGLFSFFPRRSLVRHLKLSGQQGAKAIDLYYECAYSTCMDTGLFAAKKTLSLAGFATESLSSGSSEVRLAGALVLSNLLHERETDYSSQELRSRIISSNKTVSMLVGMLGWADGRNRDIRLLATRIITNLADSLTISEVPGMLKLVSSLLDADYQPAKNEPEERQDSLLESATSVVNGQRDQASSVQTVPGNNGGCHWLRRCWRRTKEKWSVVLEEQPLTHQDSLNILGMVILERLAHDPDNCAEIAKATYLISKIIRLISYPTVDRESSNDHVQQHAVIFSSLNFVRRLAITGETTGEAIRQELCRNSFLLNNLECVLELEDGRMSTELMKLVIEILTKLAFDKDAREEIGSSKVTISKLMHAFIGKDGPTDAYYDQSLRMPAGEALANLTIENPANCLAILEEPGYELIKDLKDMLCKDEYRYVAASLLQNVCAHSRDKLGHYQGAGDHLSSSLPMLMENIMSSAGGKQLEPLIGLVSQICDVIPEPFAREVQRQLQTNGSSGLVQKLVGTLNSNRKPNPEYPRMRRVIVEMVISIVKSCPRYATIFRDKGMMEALSKVERTPSKVEKYRVFYGNVGVVPESGSPLAALVATAKGLLVHPAAPALGA